MLTTWSSSFGLCGAPGMFPPLSLTPTNLIHTTRPPISRTDPATSRHVTRFPNGSRVHPPRHPFRERIPRPSATSPVSRTDPVSTPTSPVLRTDPASTPHVTLFTNGSRIHPPRHARILRQPASSPVSRTDPASAPLVTHFTHGSRVHPPTSPVLRTDSASTHVTHFTHGFRIHPPTSPILRTDPASAPPHHPFHARIPHPPPHFTHFTNGSHVHPPFHPFCTRIPQRPAISSVSRTDLPFRIPPAPTSICHKFLVTSRYA